MAEKKRVDAKFTEACFLADYMDIIAGYGQTQNSEGFKNFKVIDCEPEAAGGAHQIISRLTSRDGLKEFLRIPPAALAVLQPKVRLFKMVYGPQNASVPIAEPEFIFDDFYSKTNVDSIFSGNNFRVGGAGLKDVSWKLAGTNPAEAEKVINVEMSFEFQTASDLLGDRANTDGSIKGGTSAEDQSVVDMQANLIDLILHPPGLEQAQSKKAKESANRGEYVPKFYRIRMDIGWADPYLVDGKFPGLSTDESNQLRQELKKQQMSIILNLVSHKLDLNENGKVSLTVEYIGALEESINGNAANILSIQDKLKKVKTSGFFFGLFGGGESYDEVQKEIETKRERIADMEEYIECLKLKDEGDDKDKEIDAYKDNIEELEEDIIDSNEDIEEMTAEARGMVYKQFLSHLNEKVYSFSVEEDEVEKWVESINKDLTRPTLDNFLGRIKRTTPDSAGDAEAAIDETVDEGRGDVSDVSDQIETAKDEQEDPEKGYINFLYFGDIIEAACEILNPQVNKQSSSSVFMFGPIVLTHPRGTRVALNIADIPIAYTDFEIFFFETVVRPQLASYPLKQFMKDVLERLVKKTLQPSECFEHGRDRRSINLSLTNFTITKDVADRINISNMYTGEPTGRLLVSDLDIEVDPPIEGEELVNCMFFYMNSYAASELLADEEHDRKLGIYHFYIGAEAGIVKSIDYSRVDVEGLRGARQAEVRNLGQIRDVYNASVTLAGNSLFYPGMKVFLNPPLGFGRPENDAYGTDDLGSIANLLGIGGYYDVITVESTISRGGQYETTLDCVFAQSGGKGSSVEAKCDAVLKEPPERDIGVFESVTTAIGNILPF